MIDYTTLNVYTVVVCTTVYCKLFKVEKFDGFRGSLQNFSSEIACAALAIQDYCPTVNVFQQITV